MLIQQHTACISFIRLVDSLKQTNKNKLLTIE